MLEGNLIASNHSFCLPVLVCSCFLHVVPSKAVNCLQAVPFDQAHDISSVRVSVPALKLSPLVASPSWTSPDDY